MFETGIFLKFLLEERKIRNHLQNVERDERDYFTYMSNTVRDSHEKQRWQSDRTKYWSLILTIISSFLSKLKFLIFLALMSNITSFHTSSRKGLAEAWQVSQTRLCFPVPGNTHPLNHPLPSAYRLSGSVQCWTSAFSSRTKEISPHMSLFPTL